MPSNKVSAATAAGMVGTIAFWLLSSYAHVEVPQAVQVAVVGLLALGFGYFWPEGNPAPSAVETVRRKGLA